MTTCDTLLFTMYIVSLVYTVQRPNIFKQPVFLLKQDDGKCGTSLLSTVQTYKLFNCLQSWPKSWSLMRRRFS